MAHTFTQVMKKLNKKSYTPTLLFTPPKNGGGDKHVNYGFYEVEGCLLGPVMLRYYERYLCDGTPYTCAAVRVKKSNFEDWAPDYTGNANFNSAHTFLFNAREPSDFVKESFTPDLAVAVPVIVGAAIKFAPMFQQYMMMTAHTL
ncbi:MAG: hypothetical protein K5912_02055 [Alphaproteobacteria bacterium]|nr:hypothetical protein [Alphaproteobacteria bacterium]